MSTIVEFQVDEALVRHRAMNTLKPVLQSGVGVKCVAVVCAVAVSEPELTGLVVSFIETTEASIPYDINADTASFDITITNYTGVALTTLVLHQSHDGNGTTGSVAMPTTLAIGASATVTLNYTTDSEVYDPTITLYVTGTKPDTSTETSNTLVLLVDIDDTLIEGGS